MKIIGVDLGTTNSCVYHLDELGNPVLALMAGKYKIFPSAVWCAGPGKEVIVGHAAKQRVGQQPPPVLAIKRLMGTTETVPLGGGRASPVDVSAEILRYAKRQVEEATGDQIGGVVVTVPAYFNAAPKSDTYQAAVRAFFDGDEAKARGRIELQLEPEAAAYAYASEDPADALRVLVYDLGGGTFDVTLLEKSRDVGLTVLKFGGDPHLGGDNIDDRIAIWFAYLLRGGSPDVLDRLLADRRYPAEQQYTLLQRVLANDVTVLDLLRPEDRALVIGAAARHALDFDPKRPDDLSRIQVLKRLAEVAKIDLTTQDEALIVKQGAFEDQRGDMVDIDLTLSRTDFNRLIGDFIATTVDCTLRVFEESRIARDAVDRVLLVGGSSRMPIVREALQRICDRPILLADPDLIVARGAAFRARGLTPPPLTVKPGEVFITLEYPPETPDDRIDVRGTVGTDVRGHAYLLHDGREVADGPISGGRFTFSRIRLHTNAVNMFHVEAMDERERLLAEHDFMVRHDERAAAGHDRLGAKITQPIRALSTRGYHPLFPEGTPLPYTRPFSCYRATNDDHVDIEFYEGDRHLATLHIANVDPALPVGTPIDLEISISATYDVSATAAIKDTKQVGTVDFKITRLTIPPLTDMDEDFRVVGEQIDNDVNQVHDVNQRLTFTSRAERLTADYTKARKAFNPDLHKLYSTVGELRTLLVEIRAAHILLEPPREEFEGLVSVCRGLAKELPATALIKPADVLERIGSLERAGQEAWQEQDAAAWNQVTSELRKQHDNLRAAIAETKAGDRRPLTAVEIARGIQAWLAEIREKIEQNHLAGSFATEAAGIEQRVRDVELRDADKARDTLLDIVDRQLRPLDQRVDRAIEESGATPRTARAKVSF